MKIFDKIKRYISPSLLGGVGVGFFVACCLAACTADDKFSTAGGEQESVNPNAIHIGGIDFNGADMISASFGGTRAEEINPHNYDAADVCQSWLRDPLFAGWDVTYWRKADATPTPKIAKITLQKDNNQTDLIKRDDKGFPDYTFKYRSNMEESTWTDALWHGDGKHIFQGVYAPATLYGGSVPATLTTDQNNSINYDLLSHYLAMGPKCEIVASVARTSLPYRHRLARLLLYILIDPNLKNADGTKATIKGYQLEGGGGTEDDPGKDNPSNSSIRLSNVNVLQEVTKTDNVALSGHSTYTPIWKNEPMQIIPHSLGEFGTIDAKGNVIDKNNCIVYYDDFRETYIVPNNKRWTYYHDNELARVTNNDTITRIDYGLVPCYDLIVRPTYTSIDSVMYDEQNPSASFNNSFDIKITLTNGLTHTSHVTFNLNANYQLAGYVLVNREEINYETSNAVLWDEKVHKDGWYGTDNELGHTLSKAGSSWQRAFRIGSAKDRDNCDADEVTDGNFYDKDTSDDKDGAGQYLSKADWTTYFQQAKKGGAHHGDYFILDQDITLDGGITFTGHLDAQGHKITFTNALTGLNGNYSTAQESDESATWEANVHKEVHKRGNETVTTWVPWKKDAQGDDPGFGYRAEILNAVISGDNFVPMTDGQYTDAVTGYIYNCRKVNTNPNIVVYYPDNMKAIPEY